MSVRGCGVKEGVVARDDAEERVLRAEVDDPERPEADELVEPLDTGVADVRLDDEALHGRVPEEVRDDVPHDRGREPGQRVARRRGDEQVHAAVARARIQVRADGVVGRVVRLDEERGGAGVQADPGLAPGIRRDRRVLRAHVVEGRVLHLPAAGARRRDPRVHERGVGVRVERAHRERVAALGRGAGHGGRGRGDGRAHASTPDPAAGKSSGRPNSWNAIRSSTA